MARVGLGRSSCGWPVAAAGMLMHVLPIPQLRRVADSWLLAPNWHTLQAPPDGSKSASKGSLHALPLHRLCAPPGAP